MELAELTAYAKEKYQMEEMHKWAGFPGFSVLCHPQTGQWIALLMRQWDSDSGMTIERCDLKCGVRALSEYRKPYLSSPIRMQGSKWIGISFGRETEAEVILALFDRAVALGNGNINLGNKIVALKNGAVGSGDGKVNGGISGIYRDTVLPKRCSVFMNTAGNRWKQGPGISIGRPRSCKIMRMTIRGAALLSIIIQLTTI